MSGANSRHRRQRLHRLGLGQGAGEGRPPRPRARRQFARPPAPTTEVEKDIEFIAGDIRDAAAVEKAAKGMDEVHHLAFVNGTEFFYSQPDLVLDVGVRGMLNVIDACRKHDSALSFSPRRPRSIRRRRKSRPTSARRCRSPILLNPRYSYGGGKLISELMAINFGRKYFERVLIFRPHNVYGPDMGFEHVVPQFALRLKSCQAAQPSGTLRFEIQGTGEETRSFCFIDDLVAGVMVMREKGEHLGIYHVGTTEEITIADLARRIAAHAGREIEFVPGKPAAGGTPRRCPDISKLAALGYKPRVPLTRASNRRSTGTGATPNWRRKPDAEGQRSPCVPPKSRAPPAPAPAFRSKLPDLRPRTARCRAVARLHAAGQPDGADRPGAAPAALVSDRPPALPRIAISCSSASPSTR